MVLPDFGLAAQIGVALVSFAGTSLIVSALRFTFSDSETFLFVYVPVIGGTAYLGGRRAGLILAFLALMSAGYHRFASAFDLTTGNLLGLGLFAVVVFLTALGPARLRDIEREAEKAHHRLTMLADASALLGEGFEHEASLKHVAHLTVPGFADWCVVELVEDGVIKVIARTPATAQDPEHLSLLGALGTKTVLRAPIRHNEEIDGAIAFGRGNSRAWFHPADQLFAEDLGRRCGVAVALGRAYANQRAIAETLQRNLLPQRLPELPTAVVSARYLPAKAAEIGGDWYDVIPLPDGQIGLAMGDVAGRGVDAAALMGQLRTALQVLALEGHPPSVVLQRLQALLRQLPLHQMVTLIYMVVSTETMRMRFTNAGHPPPLVVTPDGTTRYLVEGATVPLGVKIAPIPPEAEVPVPAKSTVVLYTDGLIERRGVGIDQGLASLEEVVRRGPIDPEAVCTRLLEEMVAGGPMHDDVALLAMQIQGKTAAAASPNPSK